MIPLYKRGGPHKKEGVEYSFKSVSPSDVNNYLNKGWFREFKDVTIEEAEFKEVKIDAYETELRDAIKALNGKPGGRSSIETLEKQLKELQDAN